MITLAIFFIIIGIIGIISEFFLDTCFWPSLEEIVCSGSFFVFISGVINSPLKIKQNYTKIKKYIQEKQTFYKNQYIYI